MRITVPRSFLPLLSSLAMTPWSPAATAQSTESLPDGGRIEVFQSPERVLVMIRIGDGELIPMVFDTGSDGNSIDRLIVERARLKTVGTTKEIDGTTGAVRMLPSVEIRDARIGGLTVDRLEAVSLDYNRDDAMGIISTETFTRSLVFLDLGNSEVRLAPRESTAIPAGPATEYLDGLPTVHMTMPDGSSLPAHFDTGFNGALSLPIDMMDKVPLVSPAQVVGTFRSINSEGEVYGGRIDGTIQIGPVALKNPEVTFLGDIANIGLPTIRQITLVLDPQAKRNWILAQGEMPGAQ